MPVTINMEKLTVEMAERAVQGGCLDITGSEVHVTHYGTASLLLRRVLDDMQVVYDLCREPDVEEIDSFLSMIVHAQSSMLLAREKKSDEEEETVPNATREYNVPEDVGRTLASKPTKRNTVD